MNENTFRSKSWIRASDSAHGHEKHEALLRAVLSCPLSCTDVWAREPRNGVEALALRKQVGHVTALGQSLYAAVTRVELRLGRTALRFCACYKTYKSARLIRMDGFPPFDGLLGDPPVIQMAPIRRTIPGVQG